MTGKDKSMENMNRFQPQYRSSVYVDGNTYQLTLSFNTGEPEARSILPHSHAQFELHALLQGEMTIEPEGYLPLTLRAGESCIIPPRIYHLRRFESNQVHCAVLSIACPKGSPLMQCDFGCVRLKSAALIQELLSRMEREVNIRQIGSDSSIQSLFTLLLVTILRELTALPQAPVAEKAIPIRRDELIDNFFACNYGQEISARDLAAYIGVTTRQLARIMQQRYGCTFRQRLLEIRLYHARKRLAETDDTVLQIAAACGFSSQSAFATAFRKHVGYTPSEYRRKTV